MKKGMFVVCGNSIEEIEADVKAMKLAIANGESSGCGSVAYAMGMGGMSDEDIMATVGSMVGTPPTADDECCCGCCCEDEDDDVYAETNALVEKYGMDEVVDCVLGCTGDYDLILDEIPLEDIIEYVKENL